MNKIIIRKAVIALGVAVFFEAMFVPSMQGSAALFYEEDGGNLPDVHVVLKEYRTGLNQVEELRLAELIQVESLAHRLDPLFVLALIKTESDFYHYSKSDYGAVGLMQVLPSTGEEVSEKLKLRWDGEPTLWNPYLNVKIGIYYLTSLKERYDGNTEAALAAYNVGPGSFDARTKQEAGRVFVNRVLNNYKDLKERVEYH